MPAPIVIDADTHAFEPLERFDRYLAEPYKHRKPLVLKDQWGITRILLEGRLYPDPSITVYEAHERLRGTGMEKNLPEGVEMAMCRPGVTDADARVRDLGVEGIDVQVILGSLGLVACTLSDPAFAAAFCRACNDSMVEFCSAHPDRLKPIAVVPLQDVPAAIAELRRSVRELGVVGVGIPPSLPGRNLDHPDLYPFYAEAQTLNVPISLHWGNGTYLPGAGTERFKRHFQNHVVGHPFEQMLAMAALVCGGILELFPGLRFGFLESGCGWVAYWTWRLDEEYHGRSPEVPLMKDKPSNYLQRGGCFFGCSPDEFLIPAVAAVVGEDTLIFSSDYPHADGLFPDAVKTIRERQDLSDQLKRKILGENAARFYGLGDAKSSTPETEPTVESRRAVVPA
jgi:hypothetical protein